MRVVLLTYFLPPDPEVGGLRAHRVAKALAGDGHDVIVVCPANDRRTTAASEDAGYRVAPVRSWPSPRDFYLGLKRWVSGAAKTSGGPATSVAASVVPDAARVPALKRFVFSLMWLPDDRQGFIMPAALKVRSLARNEPSMVYSTAPPFSVHLAARIGAALARSSWVAEYRDPWEGNIGKPPHVRSRPVDHLDGWLERGSLRGADRIIAVSDGIADSIGGRFPALNDRLITIRNGIGDLRPPPSPEDGSGPAPIRILHVGSLYHDRDPRPFLEGVKLTHERRPGAKIEVDFVGQVRSFDGIDLAEYTRQLGIDDMVTFHDWVPHDRCLAMIQSADLLLLLAQNQPLQVPNKLYEYLGARRPILAYADQDGEVTRMLEQLGGHFLVTDGAAAPAAAAIEDLVDGRLPRVKRPELLAEWTTERQMQRLLTVIGA